MKNTIKSITGIICSGVLAVSCLDLNPEAQLSDAQVWSKAENFQLFANQFYGWTRDFSAKDNYQSPLSDGPHSDYRSDLLCDYHAANIWSNGTNPLPSKSNDFNNLYKRIYYTNLLIKNASDFSNKKAIAAPLGEAYFFRAYFHFELVQLFGDAILVTEPLDIDSKQLFGKRNDRLEVINQCISDLKAAAELLPDVPSQAGRLCSYTAWAFLSRVALYEGSWQKFHKDNMDTAKPLFKEASDAASKVMESKNYELFYSEKLGGRDSYRYMFVLESADCNPAKLTKADNMEYILYTRHDQALKPINFNITKTAFNNVYNVTKKMADMYRCQDGLPISVSPLFKGYDTAVSEFENRDNRMNATLLKHGQPCWNNEGNFSRKTWDDADLANSMSANVRNSTGYANYKWATEREVPTNSEAYDYPVIRYAEVLLNYAEAVYEYSDAISDVDLDKSLNLVRHRSNPDMKALSNSLVAANPRMSMREEIRAERTVELFLEGFRIDDLKRWKTAETEMPGDLLGIKWKGTWFETNWPGQEKPINSDGNIIMFSGRQWEQKHYLLPLPSDQRQLNKELGQNPGWDE